MYLKVLMLNDRLTKPFTIMENWRSNQKILPFRFKMKQQNLEILGKHFLILLSIKA